MSKRTLVAVFEREADLVRAVAAVRAAGLKIRDVYSPFAVHGLDCELGWRPSRLSWACAFCGLAGAIFMLWFQWWTSAVSWPLNVGGKPWNSLPAYVPVTFEVMVLYAGLGVVLAFLLRCGLRPGREPRPLFRGTTDDRFVLVVECPDGPGGADAVRQLFHEFHAAPVTGQDF